MYIDYKHRIFGLDVVRATAILFVLISHSTFLLFPTQNNFIITFIRFFGTIGVDLFFVLSGFLITYLLIVEKKMNGQIDIKKFWMRRILRIWPLFFACVFFGFYVFPFIKSLFGEPAMETASIGYYLTFNSNLTLNQTAFSKKSSNNKINNLLYSSL